MNRRVTFTGNTQTCYGDWAKELVKQYSGDLKYEFVPNTQTVIVYSDNVDVGLFNFEKSYGELLGDLSIKDEPSHRKDPQYMKFDVTTFIK